MNRHHTARHPLRYTCMELTAYIFRPRKPFDAWELMIITPDAFVDGDFSSKKAAMEHATQWAAQRNLTVVFFMQPPLPDMSERG